MTDVLGMNPRSRMKPGIIKEARGHEGPSTPNKYGNEAQGLVGPVSHQEIEISHYQKETEWGMKLKIRMKPE